MLCINESERLNRVCQFDSATKNCFMPRVKMDHLPPVPLIPAIIQRCGDLSLLPQQA